MRSCPSLVLWCSLLSLTVGWCACLSPRQPQSSWFRHNSKLQQLLRRQVFRQQQQLQRQSCTRRNGVSLEGDDESTTITIGTNDTVIDTGTPMIPFLDIALPETSTRRHYNWREFVPQNTSLLAAIVWMVTGKTTPTTKFVVSDAKLQRNLAALARTLILLRAYERQYGMTTTTEIGDGGPTVQRQVLSDIIKDLYGSGAPIWVLETVMERVAEGMTGRRGVQYMLLPNRCFIFYPDMMVTSTDGQQEQQEHRQLSSTTDMFKVVPGFYIARLGAVEQVAVRLASFASNTKSVERLHPEAFRTPRRDELLEIQTRELQALANTNDGGDGDEEIRVNKTATELSREILNLASSTYGLFFFLNNPKFQAALSNDRTDFANGDKTKDPVHQFWTVSPATQELFRRLATAEAAHSLKQIHSQEKILYSPTAVAFFRMFSAAGACAMWFGGSFSDMVASAILSVLVPYVETFRNLAAEERFLTEVVASFGVGLIAGLLALKWPDRFCFGAIAVASVMDLLQGFKVVYAAIEVMSRHVVAGAGRLLEGVLFTGLISYSLKSGLDFAFRLMLGSSSTLTRDYSSMLNSAHGIRECFFPLILPFAAVAWSGLFRPSYVDLPLMAFHGMLAFGLTWAGAPLFMSAAAVTLSAGIISRFTGREALGNTLAGLYALVPGTYM